MIDWIKGRSHAQAKISAAIVRMISKDEIKLEQVAKLTGRTEENITSILMDNTEELEPATLVKLFKELNISPAFMVLEEGLPAFQTETCTGRLLKALNDLIAKNAITTYAEYLAFLNINSTLELTRLIQGAFELDWQDIHNLIKVFKINPAWLYSPNRHSPMYVN